MQHGTLYCLCFDHPNRNKWHASSKSQFIQTLLVEWPLENCLKLLHAMGLCHSCPGRLGPLFLIPITQN